MIGLDTNILTRYFAQDDTVQSPKANAVMAGLSAEEPGWVSVAALLELVWVLTSKFRAGRPEICRVLDELLSHAEISVESPDMVRRALNLYRKGNADFADCLISSSAHEAGCTQTLTLDQNAAKSAGMTLVS